MAVKLENKLLNLAKVVSLIDDGHLSLKEGAELLNYSYWHFTRVYKRYKTQGFGNLFKRERKGETGKLKHEDIELLKEYYLNYGKPQISLLYYFLSLDYSSFPEVSAEWIRRILIREGIYSSGERRKVFRRRFEAPFPGLLVQGDSTPKQWIPGDKSYYQLIAFIDDCTRLCLAAKIVKRDTIDEHFALLKEIVKKYGRFVALYYDNDEKYSYIRHGNSRFFEYKKEKALFTGSSGTFRVRNLRNKFSSS
ncbi:MAG: helix-turn-helix domain-containing protein [candidate division WOR-3 bacterium]